jgi:membrane associated rhomboid family serine protease
MLSDRSYTRDPGFGRQTTSLLAWTICAIVAGFVVQMLFEVWLRVNVSGIFELSVSGFQNGLFWTPLSYALMHDTGNYLHIIGNMLALFFFGREILPYLGNRRFLGVFLGAIAGGAALWLATNWSYGGSVVGASAGVMAVIVIYACLNPNQPITLLLFFILPVTLKPKWIAIGLLSVDLLGFAFYEALGNRSPLGFAHSAHLGGMLVGWLYFRYVHAREWRTPDAAPSVELPTWFKRAKQSPATAAPSYKVNFSNREDLRAEVDRILDKINSEGFGALTADEKRLLDDAREALGRR